MGGNADGALRLYSAARALATPLTRTHLECTNAPMGNIGYGLDRARQHAGLSKRALCRRLDIVVPTWDRYVTGEASPRYALIERVASLCGVTVPWIQRGGEPTRRQDATGT